MKIIRTFDDWCDNALALLKNSKYCYLVSFNLNYQEGDKVYQILKQAIDIEHRILIGLNTMICKANCEACNINNQVKYDNVRKLKDLTDNYKIAQALHMKAFITSNGVIVGGMNITGSGWTDRSFVSHDKKLVKELIADFNQVYVTSEPYVVPAYIHTTKIFTFGKYKGRLIEEVRKENPGYIAWLQNNGAHNI
jgi:hypothetical protein